MYQLAKALARHRDGRRIGITLEFLRRDLRRGPKRKKKGKMGGGVKGERTSRYDCRVNQQAEDGVALWLADRLLGDSMSDADALVLDRMGQEVERGATLDEQLRELSRKRPEAPGEFGLEHAVAWMLPFVVGALKRFASAFIEKLGERAAELSADAVRERVRESVATDPAVLALLESSFAERAASMNLPRSSYAAYVDELRRRPDILLQGR